MKTCGPTSGPMKGIVAPSAASRTSRIAGRAAGQAGVAGDPVAARGSRSPRCTPGSDPARRRLSPLTSAIRVFSSGSEGVFRHAVQIRRDAKGTDASAGDGALSPAPLPRRHLRLRGDPEAQRPRLPARRRPHLHRQQLQAFANGTPGGFVLRTFALPHPELAGVGVAITEILIGLLVTDRALHADRSGRRPRPQPAALPHRQLAHDALLPRPRPRLHLRLAAAGARRRKRPARARQPDRKAARRRLDAAGLRLNPSRGRRVRPLVHPPRPARRARRRRGGDRRDLGPGQGHLLGDSLARSRLLGRARRRRLGRRQSRGRRRRRQRSAGSSLPSGAVKLGPAKAPAQRSAPPPTATPPTARRTS